LYLKGNGAKRDYRKEFSLSKIPPIKKTHVEAFTYPQCKLTFNLDDYGKKKSITGSATGAVKRPVRTLVGVAFRVSQS